MFNGTTGTYKLDAVVINQAENHEMAVIGGSPDITVNSSINGWNGLMFDSRIINRDNGLGIADDNYLLLVQDTLGGSVIWNNTIADGVGGDGILFENSASDASIPVSTYLEDTRGRGVYITPGSSGSITLSAARDDGNPVRNAPDLGLFSDRYRFTVINPGGNAIQIGDPSPAGGPVVTTDARVNFVNEVLLDELNQDFSGLFVADTSQDVFFSSTAGLGIFYNHDAANIDGTAAAIEFFQNSTGNLTFNNSVLIEDVGGAGIRITNNSVNAAGAEQARFRTLGDTQVFQIFRANRHQVNSGYAVVIGEDPVGTNAPINSLDGSAYENLVQFGSELRIGGNAATNSFGGGIHVLNNTGQVQFNNRAAITATNNSPQVYLYGNEGDINFSSLVVNHSPVGPVFPFASVYMEDNEGRINFRDIDLNVNNTIAMYGLDNSSITISGGSIDATGGTGLHIETSQPHLLGEGT